MAKQKAAHHRGTYQVTAKRVTDAAYQNPYQQCWRCHLTLPQVQAKYPRRRVHWTAGHLVDGMTDGPLAAECSVCNYGHGAAMGNRRRGRIKRANRLNTSRAW